MSTSILITGAAGFIGGSVLSGVLSPSSSVGKDVKCLAAVRSKEQVEALCKLPAMALQLNLNDANAVRNAVLENEIDVIVHTATCVDDAIVCNLIDALGERRATSGVQKAFIHSSVLTAFTPLGGWTSNNASDEDPLFEQEKEIGGPHPVRLLNVKVIEKCKALDIASFIIPLGHIYGRGTGEWRKLSVSIPAYVRTSIKNRVVNEWDVDSASPAAHISDVVALYELLLKNILYGTTIPSGEQGYYFSMAHRHHWAPVMKSIAESLHKRGLVDSAEPVQWESDEAAAKSLNFPLTFVRAMCTAEADFKAVNAYKIGWKPEWGEKEFQASIDDEVQDVLDLDTIKQSVFDTLTEKEVKP